MIITLEFLEKRKACGPAVYIFKEEFGTSADIKDIHKFVLNQENIKYYGYFNWLLVELMDRDQRTKYAIYAAKKVLHIFEDRYPYDDRPRRAIEIAEKVLKSGNHDTRINAVAYDAALHAAYAAIRDDTIDSHFVAVAAAAANDTANGGATRAIVYAAAAAADVDKIKFYKDFLKYGLELLEVK